MHDKQRLGDTWHDSEPTWTEPAVAVGKPNVLVVLLDDVGFSQLGCFGSHIETPVIDGLAAGGVRYNGFTTTALCSPTRASLLTGCDHHRVGMACIAELVNGFPNSQGRVDPDAAMLPEVLRDAGYSTFASGKWHLVAAEEQSAAGPFGNWPIGRGFERFYGFLAGDTNQWNPTLVEDNHFVDQPRSPEEGYHLTSDLVDHAIQFVVDQKSAVADKPFFCYLALGAGHSPHHAFPQDIAHYRGCFDEGWDRIRTEVFERQQRLGIIPSGALLADRGEGIPAWSDLPERHREVFARMMEVYAAYLTHADRELGRLLDRLRQMGEFDNTVVILLSDNGASAEGGYDGLLNQWAFFNDVDVSVEDIYDRRDELGSPTTFNHYPLGWAQVGNTPFAWWKRWVNAGGVRTPLVIHWSDGIASRGVIRRQLHHVVDIMPTILDVVGVAAPTEVAGRLRVPIDGVSMRYTFDQPEAPTRRTTQIFEMYGNRAVVQDGWKAVARHQRDVTSVHPQSFDDDVWELYNLDDDFSELVDLAADEPERAEQMVRLWWERARAGNVLPLDDRLLGRDANAKVRERTVFHPGAAPLNPWFLAGVHGHGHEISTEVNIPVDGAQGVILSLGGRFGGWCLFVLDGRLTYEYNYGDIERYSVADPHRLPPGRHEVGARVEPDGCEAHVGLLLDGELVAKGAVVRTFPYVMGLEPLTCGYESQTPVSPSYMPPFRFTGGLGPVTVRVTHPVAAALGVHDVGALLLQD